MKNQIVACSLWVWLIPAIARGDSCGAISTLAVKLFPNTDMASPSDLRFELQGRPFKAETSPDQELPGFWTYRTTNLRLEQIIGLVPTAACMVFSLRGAPYVARLPVGKADAPCYAVFQFDAKPTCWSLRVKSDPYGYPFQLAGRSKHIIDGFDKNWNVERNLPQKVVEVKIFDPEQIERCLFAIDKVAPVTVANGLGKLDQEMLEQYACSGKKLPGSLAEDSKKDILAWQKSNTSPVSKIKSIELAVEETLP
jgi:hypothetical protein